MSYQNVLSLIGGLCLFLFGMQIMGTYLEKRAGSRLRLLIGKLTTNRLVGFLTGLGVTAIIQSSSATTVMVVGFVNSGIMSLRQAINVIMGANVGTTVTSWLLSLTGISSSNPLVAMLKPSNFTPLLALLGIVFFMSAKSEKRKDTGAIFLGFTTLMFGMETMSTAVSGLRDVPEFQNILLLFSSPIFGVLAGALLTAIIQSSSASVGILQALASTGAVTIGTAIPIIMGQNIGTCVTAMLSSIGANKNARRAAVVHLCFNVLGTCIFLSLYCLAKVAFQLPFSSMQANAFSIAVVHTAFNIACTACMFPLAAWLEKMAMRLIPDHKEQEVQTTVLDERLLATPAIALERCRSLSIDMAKAAVDSLTQSIAALDEMTPERSEQIREKETQTDRDEDQLGSYLVKLSSHPLSEEDGKSVSMLLHVIGDFERIADHAVNILESAEEMKKKDVVFSHVAQEELAVFTRAVQEILEKAVQSYQDNDVSLASTVEPLEQLIDSLKDQIRTRHILRLQAGSCSLNAGFILSDLLTNLERVADHCSNIAGSVIEMQYPDLALHEYLTVEQPQNAAFQQEYHAEEQKYHLP